MVHRFRNIGDTTACMLDWNLPGGEDHYFKAISDLTADGSVANSSTLPVAIAPPVGSIPVT